MKKRILSMVLTMSLAFSMIATSALAADDHVHDETCGYNDGQCVYELYETGEDENLTGVGAEGETETSTEEITESQENPDTETLEETEKATEEPSGEEDAAMPLESEETTPLLGSSFSVAETKTDEESETLCDHGNDADSCAVCALEEQIAALPELDEIQTMTGDEEEALYAQASALADVCYDDLTADEQAQVFNIDTLWDILDYFSSGLMLIALSADTSWYNSTSTSFTITTASQLAGLASLVNAGNDFSGKIIKLGNSINLNSESWTPIGTTSNPFKGTFDGQGYTVQNLSVSGSTYVGLFGYADGSAVIKNVTVTGSVMGTDYVGGIVGRISSGVTVEYCTNSAEVSIISSSFSETNVGGIVGFNLGGTISNCINTGKVSGVSSSQAGGITGRSSSGTVSNCYNTGEVNNSSSGNGTGGVVGSNQGGTISNCYNIGTISGFSFVGGVFGLADGTMSNNYYLSDTSDTATDQTAKTAAQFASGEVAYLLQKANTDYVWGQSITGSTTDAYPILISYADSKADKEVVQIAFYKAPNGTAADTPFEYGYTNVGKTLASYPSDAEYTFFAVSDLTGQIDPTTRTYSADTSVYAYVVSKYTVKWFDEDGTLLKTDTDVEEGTTPSYSGATPTKASDGLYIYTFSGWSPEVGEMTADTYYTAQYSKTYVAPAAGAGYTIDYSEETATAASGYEISTDGSTWSSSGTLTVTPNGTLYVRRAADAAASASAETTNTLADRPSAPSVTAVDEQWLNENDGQITGVTAEMEYRLSGGTWADCSGTTVAGLAAGSYEVRYKATASAFAGTAATVTIASGTARTYTLTVTAPDFTVVTYGYTQPDAASIMIKSSGNSTATITSVTVDPDNFTIGTGDSSVTAGGTNASYTIQPKTGLAADTYTATITVTYDGGATATNTVSFTVGKAEQVISYSESDVEKHINDACFTNSLTQTIGDGTITYTSSDPDVATVDATSGKVTIVGSGTATITAKAAATENYNEETAFYTLTVTDHSYTATVVSPTYAEQGYTLHTCEHCDNSYKTNYTAIKVIDGTDGNLSTKTTVLELAAVPDGLKNLYSSVDELISDLISRVVAVGTGYTEDNTLVYDVMLQYSTDGGTTWITATVDNFPADGITVTLPYPDGTDSSYEFTVLHMFTVDSDRLGITAGDTESPTVTKTEDGLVFTLTGLSPVAVSWKAVTTSTTETDTSSQTDTATESTDTSGTSASSTTSAQTGDNSRMMLWLVLLLLSGVGAAGIAFYNTKRRRSR